MFLIQDDYNVIIVHWDGESDDYYYPKAASNVRSVAAELALVIGNLKQNGGSTKSLLYCIGHSIGAHVCGLAGHLTSIGRITGYSPDYTIVTVNSLGSDFIRISSVILFVPMDTELADDLSNVSSTFYIVFEGNVT